MLSSSWHNPAHRLQMRDDAGSAATAPPARAPRSSSPARRRPPAPPNPSLLLLGMPPLMRRPGGPRQLSVPALACIVGVALVLALCLLAARWPPDGVGACQRPPPEGAPRIHRVPYSSGSNSSDGSAATDGDSSGGSAGGGGAAGAGPGVDVGRAVREDRCSLLPVPPLLNLSDY